MQERLWRKVNLVHCWWECKLIQPLWRTIWKFLKKQKIELPHDPAIKTDRKCNTPVPLNMAVKLIHEQVPKNNIHISKGQAQALTNQCEDLINPSETSQMLSSVC